MKRTLNYSELISLLKANGFEMIRRANHQIWSNGKKTVSVPQIHHHQINRFTLKQILKNAGLELS